MPVLPCGHCGLNYMRNVNAHECEKLCNACMIREEKRNPKKEIKMKMITISIQCTTEIQNEIEEFCMANGFNFSEYFLKLHCEYLSSLQGRRPRTAPIYQDTIINPEEKGESTFEVTKKDLTDSYEKTLPKKNKVKK